MKVSASATSTNPVVNRQQAWVTKFQSLDRSALLWQSLSAFLAALVLLPLLVIIAAWLRFDASIWSHLIDTVFLTLLKNTAILVFGVACGVCLIGVPSAWLTCHYEFPGRRLFELLLVLPLAIPGYVIAFVTLGIFDFDGPVQAVLSTLGFEVYFDIRSPLTVIVVLSLVLYPYVFLLTRVAFSNQSSATAEAARSMGLSAWQRFSRLNLPLARPAIVAGMSLALMETLADFGAVSVFNYDTFTTAIYKTWYGLFNLDAAAQLASLLLLLVTGIILAEQMSRKQAKVFQQNSTKTVTRNPARGKTAVAIYTFLGIIVSAAFILPVLQLLAWSLPSLANVDSRFTNLIGHTVALGLGAAVLTVFAALILLFVQRQFPSRLSHAAQFVGRLGYALPGSVLAVGIMLGVTWLSAGAISGLAVGGVGALILAYYIRFAAVAAGPIQSRFEQIQPQVLEASSSLGRSPKQTFRQVVIPLLSPGLVTAMLLVLVDVMKEMPATLLLRPFGWDTLAVRIYEMTAEGEWQAAALPALCLVLIGLIPVLFLMKKSSD